NTKHEHQHTHNLDAQQQQQKPPQEAPKPELQKKEGAGTTARWFKKHKRLILRITIALLLLFALGYAVFVAYSFWISTGLDLVLYLTPYDVSKSLENGQNTTVHLNLETNARFFCTTACIAQFIDLAKNKTLENQSFTLQSGDQKVLSYRLVAPRIGFGQQLYLVKVTCQNQQTVLCQTSGKPTTEVRLIHLEYQPSTTTLAAIDEIKKDLHGLTLALQETSKQLQYARQLTNKIPASFQLLPAYQERLAKAETSLSELTQLLALDIELYNNQEYELLRKTYSKEKYASLQLLASSIEQLTHELRDELETYNKIITQFTAITNLTTVDLLAKTSSTLPRSFVYANELATRLQTQYEREQIQHLLTATSIQVKLDLATAVHEMTQHTQQAYVTLQQWNARLCAAYPSSNTSIIKKNNTLALSQSLHCPAMDALDSQLFEIPKPVHDADGQEQENNNEQTNNAHAFPTTQTLAETDLTLMASNHFIEEYQRKTTAILATHLHLLANASAQACRHTTRQGLQAMRQEAYKAYLYHLAKQYEIAVSTAKVPASSQTNKNASASTSSSASSPLLPPLQSLESQLKVKTNLSAYLINATTLQSLETMRPLWDQWTITAAAAYHYHHQKIKGDTAAAQYRTLNQQIATYNTKLLETTPRASPQKELATARTPEQQMQTPQHQQSEVLKYAQGAYEVLNILRKSELFWPNAETIALVGKHELAFLTGVLSQDETARDQNDDHHTQPNSTQASPNASQAQQQPMPPLLPIEQFAIPSLSQQPSPEPFLSTLILDPLGYGLYFELNAPTPTPCPNTDARYTWYQETYLQPLASHNLTPINLTLDPVTINQTFTFIEPSPMCCIYGKCKPCCAGASCSTDPLTYPVIFLHGHAFNARASPKYSLEAFNKIQAQLEKQGFINGGFVSLLVPADEVKPWGFAAYPATFKATYYFDVTFTGEGYTLVPKKSESIEVYALRLRTIIDYVKKKTGKEKVNIVAHSMGGLVARRYLQVFGEQDVNTIIMIGTPQQGIRGPIETFCPLFGEKRECEEMAAGSTFLNKLNDPRLQPKQTKLMTIIGTGCTMGSQDGDGIVLTSDAMLPNAKEYRIVGSCDGTTTLHTEMLDTSKYPEVVEYVLEALQN
ncbi:MAG: alpha/beta fold hydrolase, partial [Candidatus Woesearchaeota archaeon]